MGLIPLKEYAQRHGKDPVVVRNKALRGSFETARKIGRQWFIDEDEPYGQTRSDQGYHRPEAMSLSGGVPDGMILLKEYAERNELNALREGCRLRGQRVEVSSQEVLGAVGSRQCDGRAQNEAG